MEQTFSNTPSAASLFNFSPSASGQQTSPFSLSGLPNLPSTPPGVPHTIRLSATLPRNYPPSLPFPGLHEALAAAESGAAQLFLSPDPPASGPGSRPTSRLRNPDMMSASTRSTLNNAAAAAAVAAQNLNSAVAAATSRRPSTSRRRTARRIPAPEAASAVVSESSTTEPNMDVKPAAAPRRSSRARKRAPAVKPEDESEQPAKKRRGNLKKPPPGSAGGVKSEQSDDEAESGEEVTTASCCICMDEPKPADLASISGCDHLFCFECIEKWAERENTCPLCKVRFAKIDRVNKSRKKGGSKNTKRVKQKDQRSDIAPGAALEGLLASFASSANFPPHRVARLIFSGMGGSNPFGMMSSAAAMRSARGTGPSAVARAGPLEDSLFSSDSDEDDDESFLPSGGSAVPSFHDLFRVGFGGHGGPFGSHPIHFGSGPITAASLRHHAGLPAPAARNYATNGDDQNAGNNSTNPLEIDDSDEEEIEVLQVTRPL